MPDSGTVWCGLPDLKLSDIAAALLPLLPSSGVSSGVFDEAISKLLGVSAPSDAEQDAVTSVFLAGVLRCGWQCVAVCGSV